MSPGKAALLCAILSSAAGSGAERRHTGPDSRRETDGGVTRFEPTGDGVQRPRQRDGPRDPDLEPGFPVQTFETAGGYTSGQGIHTLVANIDDDPQKEIVVTALANGPLYAWNHDGTPVPGWPSGTFWGAGYAAAGRLSPGENLQVFAGYYSGKWAAWTYPAALMPGWPLQASNYVALPPTLADIDGDGIDEIFVEGQDNCLHGFNAAAETLPGFQAMGWMALMAPTGTPAPVVKKISDDLRAVLVKPELKQRLADLGTYTRPTTPEELTAYIREQQTIWRPVIVETAKKIK